MIRRFQYIIFFILIVNKGFAQDPHFSQFFSSPLYLSPSLSGATEGTRFILNYRNQWPSIPDSYSNYAFSVDRYFKNYKSGVGFLVMRDEEGGVYGTNMAALSYAYHVRLNRDWSLNPGLNMSYKNNFLDWNDLNFGDMITRGTNTSLEQIQDPNRNFLDFNFSTIAFSEYLYVGLTVSHLLNFNKKISLTPGYPPTKLAVFGGLQIQPDRRRVVRSDKSYTVAFIYKYQDFYHQLDLGAYYERDFFRIGLFVRGSNNYISLVGIDGAILLAGFTYENFKFNLSYDIATSRLMTRTGGAIEISMLYTIPSKERSYQRRKMIPCPEF
ncbi:MAG: PorP/SprF family type IX secretion system membrane protein [Bacteroidales bacterium]|nr:PorP/SprF family type IX secretion system membrane protein [Bacteroidales bacterium]